MNQKYGFAEECNQRLGPEFGPKLFELFHKAAVPAALPSRGRPVSLQAESRLLSLCLSAARFCSLPLQPKRLAGLCSELLRFAHFSSALLSSGVSCSALFVSLCLLCFAQPCSVCWLFLCFAKCCCVLLCSALFFCSRVIYLDLCCCSLLSDVLFSSPLLSVVLYCFPCFCFFLSISSFNRLFSAVLLCFIIPVLLFTFLCCSL